MFTAARVSLSKFGTRSFSAAQAKIIPKSRLGWAFVTSATLATGTTIYAFSPTIQNDVAAPGPRIETPPTTKQEVETNPSLSPLVWGSNSSHLIAPEQPTSECIKSPTYMPQLFSGPLRDIKFSKEHAACVDAAGDVYQWGDKYYDTEAVENKRPRMSLRGKNIVSVAVTPTKIFALSASGKIYALSSSLHDQTTNRRHSGSWLLNIFGLSEPQPFHTILDTDVSLGSGEKLISISAGSDHLLALTSKGRAFAHPVTRHANLRGQLGVHKITVQDSIDPKKRLPVELLPVAPSTGLRRKSTILHDHKSEAEPSEPVNDKQVGYCDRLFEISVLRGIEIKQVTAGERSSYAITKNEGRVLAWGANEYGQLGLGGNVNTPNVPVPTEVILSKFTKRSVISRCMDISAAGDLAFFTVEREVPIPSSKVVDVLACGNGQWGGLGNATYSTAQGEPAKVKVISGILEYDEETQSLQALKPYLISVAPGPNVVMSTADQGSSTSGHALVMLDTVPHAHPTPDDGGVEDIALPLGRDVLVWGLNQHYQLGNGRRASANVPLSVQTSDGEGRLMCKVSRETVKDFQGKVVKRNGNIEQRVVAGPGFSMVYWKML